MILLAEGVIACVAVTAGPGAIAYSTSSPPLSASSSEPAALAASKWAVATSALTPFSLT